MAEDESAAELCCAQPATGESGPVPSAWKVRRRRAVRWAALGHDAAARSGPRISAVVLDMGGVVIPTLFESAAVTGFPPGPLGNDTEYRRVERGDLSERSYWAAVAKARPNVDIATLWRTCSYVRREFSGALEAIAGRARLVAFTNDMAHWFGEDWSLRFEELAIFDAIVEAAKLGVQKPDPEAFLLALAEVGEQPQHCLFVDDLDSNLEGAARIGMNTLLFDVRDPAASVARLLERLEIPDDQAGPIRAFSTPVRPFQGTPRLR